MRVLKVLDKPDDPITDGFWFVLAILNLSSSPSNRVHKRRLILSMLMDSNEDFELCCNEQMIFHEPISKLDI